MLKIKDNVDLKELEKYGYIRVIDLNEICDIWREEYSSRIDKSIKRIHQILCSSWHSDDTIIELNSLLDILEDNNE